MLRRRRSRPLRRLRRLLVLAGTIGGISAVREVMLARSEKQFAAGVGDPTGRTD